MKKLICLLLALALVGSLWACTGTTEPVAYEYQRLEQIFGTELYCDSDPNRCGVLTFTDLATGESISGMSGNIFWHWQSTDELDWENAVEEPGNLFADAKYVVRLANRENGWYAEFHDGANAHYIYFAEEGLYVPVMQGRSAYEGAPVEDLDISWDRTTEDVIQEINEEIAMLRDEIVRIDPTFRVEDTTPDEVAAKHAQHRAEMWSTQGTVTATNVQVISVSEDGTKIEYRCDFTSTDWTLFVDFTENSDGTYTCSLTDYLVLDENGLWAREAAIEFVSYG